MSKRLSRRSLLQTIVLIHLRKCTAKTITELSLRLDKSRYSVSRSLRILKDQKLVIRDKNGWRLTELGEIEAKKEEESLYEGTQDIKKISSSVIEAFNRIFRNYNFYFQKSELFNQHIDLYIKTIFDSYRSGMEKINQGLFELSKEMADIAQINIQAGFQEIGRQLSKIIEDIKANTQKIAPMLAEANFWFTPSMSLELINIIENIPDDEDPKVAVTKAFIDHFEEDEWYELRDVVDEWRKNPCFSPRMHIIEDALEAHISGKYTLSIPTLLSQAEGIASDILGVPAGKPGKLLKDAMSREEKTFLNAISTDILLGFITSPGVFGSTTKASGDFTTANFSLWLKSKGYSEGQALNRHGILHGVQIDYPSKENSLRVFLLLDVLAFIKTKNKV